MMKTEAAEIIALRVRVTARQNAAEINKDLVEAILSEAKHFGGVFPTAADAAPSWRTILRIAKRDAL